ncbi:uncharacterized protein EV422DRAFT_568672 [Fimicolochytrium jonesii]|uniref:uncharacterized protein n=1 Tax=Fimicolochytrium jonesii TaxID=1396493 RepID=UPI0022FEA0DF|nr:uncharacterized protein EV422DRAFT_568672 [Fimicolochytrium jonesii]KAI8819712.1 hypothetical protein EV422DRAFT_568672 [Fimicolochytrium jonesii]
MVNDMHISGDNIATSSSTSTPAAAATQNLNKTDGGRNDDPASEEGADECSSTDRLEGLYSEDRALDQIWYEQLRTDLCIDRDQIKELVREAASSHPLWAVQQHRAGFKFTKRAIDALHTAAEEFLVERFRLAHMLALSAAYTDEKQVKLTVENLRAAAAIMEGRI